MNTRTRRKGRSLVVDITDEDIAWARRQDQYNCAISRAIERILPDALHVKANSEEIAFSLPQDDTRYYFQTPPEVVTNIIKPFDRGEPITDRTFLLTTAFRAEPIAHRSRADKIRHRQGERRRAPQVRTKSGPTHKINRFLDYVAEEEKTP